MPRTAGQSALIRASKTRLTSLKNSKENIRKMRATESARHLKQMRKYEAAEDMVDRHIKAEEEYVKELSGEADTVQPEQVELLEEKA